VKNYWCYFSRLVISNSVTVYHIPTKLGIKVHLNTLFLSAKYQNVFCVIATFVTAQKDEEKKCQFLMAHISEKSGMEHGLQMMLGISTAKSLEGYKLHYYSYCQCTHSVACQLLGPPMS